MSKSDYFHGNNTQCYLRGSPCHPLQLPLKNLHKSPLSRGLESVQRTDYSRLKPLLFCSLSLLLHFPPFWGRRGCCYCSLLSHSGCSPRGGRAVLLFEKERSFFPPSSNSLTLFHAHTPRSPSLAAASKRESRRFRYFIILLFPFILFSEFFYDSESKKKK